MKREAKNPLQRCSTGAGNKERRSGVPILSDNASGYFLPGNSAERAQFVKSMRNRAAEILRTAAAVEDIGKG